MTCQDRRWPSARGFRQRIMKIVTVVEILKRHIALRRNSYFWDPVVWG